jgi:hypothetical protein
MPQGAVNDIRAFRARPLAHAPRAVARMPHPAAGDPRNPLRDRNGRCGRRPPYGRRPPGAAFSEPLPHDMPVEQQQNRSPPLDDRSAQEQDCRESDPDSVRRPLRFAEKILAPRAGADVV